MTPSAADDTAAIERKRLDQLGALFDEPTISRLRRFGARPGWHCLEIGAGSGSVARALAALVAPDGHVLATDVDDRFLEGDDPHLEFRVHDITKRSAARRASSTSRTRAVCSNTSGERERALAAMVAATKPGGFVVVEDPDWVVFDAQPLPEAFGVLHHTLRDAYVAAAGYDPNLGRRLPALLHDAGLVDVDAEGNVFTMRGDSRRWSGTSSGSNGRCLRSSRPASSTPTSRRRAGRSARSAAADLLSPLQMTAWGRKPR